MAKGDGHRKEKKKPKKEKKSSKALKHKKCPQIRAFFVLDTGPRLIYTFP